MKLRRNQAAIAAMFGGRLPPCAECGSAEVVRLIFGFASAGPPDAPPERAHVFGLCARCRAELGEEAVARAECSALDTENAIRSVNARGGST
jgi:hypothetical protein